MPPASADVRSSRGRRRRSKPGPILVLNLAIVLVLGAGTAAYGIMNHTITLTVDGKSSTVRTFAGTVSDVLDDHHVTVGPDDRISQPVSSRLSDGDDITVAYAKPVTLTVDGTVTEHTVYDRTVEQALDALGVPADSGAYVSADVGTKVPRDGMKLVVSTPKAVRIVADGKKSTVTTAAPTVKGVLDAAHITLDSDDEVKPGTNAYVRPGQALRVVRIEKVIKTETVRVKYDVKVQADPEAMQGETTVVQAGKPGKKAERVTLIYADGKLRKRIVIVSRSLAEPRPQIERHGTSTTPPDSVWDKIAQCESGGNWSINTGNGYYGGLQFSAATWHSVGGPGLPHQHSREVQIKYAKILQARSGWGQWGCAGARFN